MYACRSTKQVSLKLNECLHVRIGCVDAEDLNAFRTGRLQWSPSPLEASPRPLPTQSPEPTRIPPRHPAPRGSEANKIH